MTFLSKKISKLHYTKFRKTSPMSAVTQTLHTITYKDTSNSIEKETEFQYLQLNYNANFAWLQTLLPYIYSFTKFNSATPKTNRLNWLLSNCSRSSNLCIVLFKCTWRRN